MGSGTGARGGHGYLVSEWGDRDGGRHRQWLGGMSLVDIVTRMDRFASSCELQFVLRKTGGPGLGEHPGPARGLLFAPASQ